MEYRKEFSKNFILNFEGGLVTDHLLTRADIIRVSESHDINEKHGELVSILNQNISQSLSIIQNPLLNLIFTFQSIESKLKEDSK